ncbi:hypothetical protein, partial [Klebsiella pneumoniae]|uniref:hypothetical protein n=1 Tax=Klebsiella pneumoniae TaxID=573 RepID=UPI0025A2F932
VVLVLVEALGGIIDETMDELGRLARRSKGPGAVDRTRYGLHRSCPQCFVVHHMQRLSKAAVVFDAKAIKKGAISLKQQACHIRPAAVMGAIAAANAVRGGGRA